MGLDHIALDWQLKLGLLTVAVYTAITVMVDAYAMVYGIRYRRAGDQNVAALEKLCSCCLSF